MTMRRAMRCHGANREAHHTAADHRYHYRKLWLWPIARSRRGHVATRDCSSSHCSRPVAVPPLRSSCCTAALPTRLGSQLPPRHVARRTSLFQACFRPLKRAVPKRKQPCSGAFCSALRQCRVAEVQTPRSYARTSRRRRHLVALPPAVSRVPLERRHKLLLSHISLSLGIFLTTTCRGYQHSIPCPAFRNIAAPIPWVLST